MNKRIKNIVTVVLLAAFLFGFGAWAALKPADSLSLSARRRLKQIATKAELAAKLERTTMPPAQRDAVYLVYGCGYSRGQAAMERVWDFEHARIIDETAAARNLLQMLNG